MSQSLHRILRLREQSEEICRGELKREMLRLRAVEQAIQASRDECRASRSAVFHALAGNAGQDWLLAESARELAEWRIRSLQPQLEQQRQRVEELRQRFLECRKEKRQVEQLIEVESAAARAEEARRQQSALDDWYEQGKRRKRFSRK
ncbi:MAG TPA: flagellar FliJ family protein [Acidisarcina sp.]|nr:flagellar FliJ family protein [Acidisarcina sp.]